MPPVVVCGVAIKRIRLCLRHLEATHIAKTAALRRVSYHRDRAGRCRVFQVRHDLLRRFQNCRLRDVRRALGRKMQRLPVAIRLQSGPRYLMVRAAAVIRQRRDGRRKKITEAEGMKMVST